MGDTEKTTQKVPEKTTQKVPDNETEKIPEKKSVVLLLFLSIITLGIYPYFWYLKRVPELNNLETNSKAKKGLALSGVILVFLMFILSFTLSFLGSTNLDNLDNLEFDEIPTEVLVIFIVLATVMVLCFVITISLAFNVRKVLNEAIVNKGENVKISGIYTLFFNMLYLQYEINRIIDDREKAPRRGPLIAFVLFYLLPVFFSVSPSFAAAFSLLFFSL